MSKFSRYGGASFDSLVLAFVKFFTLGTGIANTMILSHSLSLKLFGTYSQGNLIVGLCADATILGLADAANFFFNRGNDNEQARKYVSTIVTLQLCVGTITAIAILTLQNRIIDYFNNPLLVTCFVYLAFRPMLTNLTTILQVLIISIGKAKLIAVRNTLFSLLKLGAVLLTSLVTSNVAILFAIILSLDTLTVMWYWLTFKSNGFLIQPRLPDRRIVRSVLSFSLPMALYVLTSSVSRQVGALVVGAREGTEVYAIYANNATILPLDVISAAFLTVIIPIATRLIGRREYDQARILFKHYLTIGYLSTITLSVACFVVAEELVQVLYGPKYLPGLAVFCLFLVSGMARFANLTLILSASGKTRVLMLISIVTLALNVVACIVAYEAIGFVGPAVASVVLNLLMTLTLLKVSSNELRGTISSVIDPRAFICYLLSVTGAAGLGITIKCLLRPLDLTPFLVVVIVVGFVVGFTLIINRRPLLVALRGLNQTK